MRLAMDLPRFKFPYEPLPKYGDHRRALRKGVKMRAHLRDRGQTRFEIDVVDLSASGFRAETSFTLWPGTVVWLTLPGLAALEAVAQSAHRTITDLKLLMESPRARRRIRRGGCSRGRPR